MLSTDGIMICSSAGANEYSTKLTETNLKQMKGNFIPQSSIHKSFSRETSSVI
jgi:hypothetical protein